MSMNKRPKAPRYGDPVFVPNLADGWIRGTVNGYAHDTNGRQVMLVAVKGHKSGSNVVAVQPNDYLKEWAWPEDMPIIQAATH